MHRPRVAIIIPALNEEATIASIVAGTRAHGVPIVVDDGSVDATAELARQAGAAVVSHVVNQGYDAALNTGFRAAADMMVEMIITVDADGQHDPNNVQRFIDAVDAGHDLVLGLRSRRQRLAEEAFAWFTRRRYGIGDPLCGMKAYRTEVFNALGHFDSYGSVGTELMIYAATKKYRITQIPFEVRDRRGQSRFGQAIWGNYKILRAMLLAMSPPLASLAGKWRVWNV